MAFSIPCSYTGYMRKLCYVWMIVEPSRCKAAISNNFSRLVFFFFFFFGSVPCFLRFLPPPNFPPSFPLFPSKKLRLSFTLPKVGYHLRLLSGALLRTCFLFSVLSCIGMYVCLPACLPIGRSSLDTVSVNVYPHAQTPVPG